MLKKIAVFLIIFTILVPFAQAENKKIPLRAVLAYNEGIKAYEEQEYDEAIEKFSTAIEIDDKFADAYFDLACVYETLNKNDYALLNFLRVIRLKPNDDEALSKVSKLYAKMGDKTNSAKYRALMSPQGQKYFPQ